MTSKEELDRNNSQDISLEDSLADLLRMMRYLRIYRVGEKFETCKMIVMNTVLVILFLANILLILSECIEAIRNLDLRNSAIVLTPVGLHFTGFVKWVYCIQSHREIGRIISQLNKCHLLCLKIDDSEAGRQLYKKELDAMSRISKLFVYGWLGFCLYGVSHWCANPLIMKLFISHTKLRWMNNSAIDGNALPYFGWQPWSIDGFYLYMCSYCLQFVGAISCILGTCSFDIFYVSILVIVCAQFRYLNQSLKTAQDKCSNASSATGLSMTLKACIHHHSEILGFMRKFQILTGIPMFVQCLETLIVICLLSFQASIIEITTDVDCVIKVFSMLDYFMGVATQLFIFCISATNVTSLSSQVANSVYFCGWEYSHKTEFKNIGFLLQVMMGRAQKPILLTGGPFYVLSLETFKSIIGLAISNSVILRQVSEE